MAFAAQPVVAIRDQFDNVVNSGAEVTASLVPSWGDFVTRRIFAPLGMTESNLAVSALSGNPNVAQPHARIRDTLRVTSYRNLDRIGPAGSINSNVLDMAKWLRFQLAGGKIAGKALVGPRAFEETRTPQLALRRGGGPNRDGYFAAYGMGWFLQDYRGRFVVHHGGNIDGMSAMVAFMPDEQVGVVVLTNMHGSPLVQALAYDVFDRYLGPPPKDRIGDSKRSRAQAATRAREMAAAAEAKRVKGTTLSLASSTTPGRTPTAPMARSTWRSSTAPWSFVTRPSSPRISSTGISTLSRPGGGTRRCSRRP